jgi:hypothetical protein
MHIIDHLLWAAERDAEVFALLQAHRDDPSISRAIDFCLSAPDSNKAETVCSFINDNQYGKARVSLDGEKPQIIVVVHMPIVHEAIRALSATMVSISHIFSVDYVGWGCCAESGEQKEPNKSPEPTSGTVTPRAEPRVAPVPPVAHL